MQVYCTVFLFKEVLRYYAISCRLEILNAGNKELEAKFNSIQQGPDEPETVEKLEVVVKAPLQAEEEKRPIPGKHLTRKQIECFVSRSDDGVNGVQISVALFSTIVIKAL